MEAPRVASGGPFAPPPEGSAEAVTSVPAPTVTMTEKIRWKREAAARTPMLPEGMERYVKCVVLGLIVLPQVQPVAGPSRPLSEVPHWNPAGGKRTRKTPSPGSQPELKRRSRSRPSGSEGTSGR